MITRFYDCTTTAYEYEYMYQVRAVETLARMLCTSKGFCLVVSVICYCLLCAPVSSSYRYVAYHTQTDFQAPTALLAMQPAAAAAGAAAAVYINILRSRPPGRTCSAYRPTSQPFSARNCRLENLLLGKRTFSKLFCFLCFLMAFLFV